MVVVVRNAVAAAAVPVTSTAFAEKPAAAKVASAATAALNPFLTAVANAAAVAEPDEEADVTADTSEAVVPSGRVTE